MLNLPSIKRRKLRGIAELAGEWETVKRPNALRNDISARRGPPIPELRKEGGKNHHQEGGSGGEDHKIISQRIAN